MAWSRFNLQFCMFSKSVFIRICCQFPLLFISCLTFIRFCFAFVRLLCLIIQCSIIRILSVIFCPDTGIVFQLFWTPYQQPTSKSINIIHQTAPSFVLIQELRAYYHHRHLVGYLEPISPNRVRGGWDIFDPHFFVSVTFSPIIFTPLQGAGGLIVTCDIYSTPLTWIVKVCLHLSYCKFWVQMWQVTRRSIRLVLVTIGIFIFLVLL
jgi:hypothetical protein